MNECRFEWELVDMKMRCLVLLLIAVLGAVGSILISRFWSLTLET